METNGEHLAVFLAVDCARGDYCEGVPRICWRERVSKADLCLRVLRFL